MRETRVEISAKFLHDKFLIKEYSFNVQYYPFYQARVAAMRSVVEKLAKRKWTDAQVVRLADLGESQEDNVAQDGPDENSFHQNGVSEAGAGDVQKPAIIIGTLFKQMPLQPSILKEVSEGSHLMAQPVSRYISDEDVLWLQDGDASISLTGEIDVDQHVTGIYAALLGHEDEHSRFVVRDVCYAQLEPVEVIERPLSVDKYIALICGLGFSKCCYENANWSHAVEMLISFLSGEQTDRYAVKGSAVGRVIIAGNCVGKNARSEETEEEVNKVPWQRKTKSNTLVAIKHIDEFLAQIGSFLPVDVMPGQLDPVSQLLPQQPAHPCVLPNSYSRKSVKYVTNPYQAEFEGLRFLGTSGQNVDSVRFASSMPEATTIMQKMIEWDHLAPTTPDTLQCYPFVDRDPFVITEYPDVFFVGNQENYNTSTIEAPNGKKILLVAVPDFESKFECVLINLRTLTCEMISV